MIGDFVFLLVLGYIPKSKIDSIIILSAQHTNLEAVVR